MGRTSVRNSQESKQRLRPQIPEGTQRSSPICSELSTRPGWNTQATPRLQSITTTTTPPCFENRTRIESALQSFRSSIARFHAQDAAALLCKSLIAADLLIPSLVSGLQMGMLRCRRPDGIPSTGLIMVMSRAFPSVGSSVGGRGKTRAKGRRHWLRERGSDAAGRWDGNIEILHPIMYSTHLACTY